MKSKSKFSEIYLKLSKRQKAAFLDFSRLQTFKLSEIDEKAIAILTKWLSPRKGDDLESNLYQQLFKKDNDANKKAFEYVKNHLLKVLISFLKWQLADNTVQGDLQLLDFYQKNQIGRNFESTARSIEKNIINQKKYYTDDFHKMQFAEILLTEREDRTRENIEIKQANTALDRLFIINKLRLYCKMVNESNLRNLPIPEEVLKPLESMDLAVHIAEDKLVLLYHSMTNMLKNEQYFEVYHTTLALVKQHESEIEQEILIEFYGYLRNRCSYYCNIGEAGFVLHFLELIKYLETKEILVINNTISLSMFKNVISAALIHEDFDWVASFIQRYSPFINREEKYGIELYHQADLKYHQGNLEETLELLSIIEKRGFRFRDQFYHISYNKLLLKIYLMKQLTIGFHNRIDTFAKYVRNHKKISKDGRTASLEFVAVAKKIYKNEVIKLEEHEGKLTVVDFQWLEQFMINAKNIN